VAVAMARGYWRLAWMQQQPEFVVTEEGQSGEPLLEVPSANVIAGPAAAPGAGNRVAPGHLNVGAGNAGTPPPALGRYGTWGPLTPAAEKKLFTALDSFYDTKVTDAKDARLHCRGAGQTNLWEPAARMPATAARAASRLGLAGYRCQRTHCGLQLASLVVHGGGGFRGSTDTAGCLRSRYAVHAAANVHARASADPARCGQTR
jgi:hypothetical protein